MLFLNLSKTDALKSSVPATSAAPNPQLCWAQTIVSTFYLNFLFHKLESDAVSTNFGVMHDQTVAIIGYRVAVGNAAPDSLVNNGKACVVAAITFCQGTGSDICNALVTTLAVAENDYHPANISSWRCRGIGSFLLVPVLKLSSIGICKYATTAGIQEQTHALDCVEFFAQCSHHYQQRFFEACGFVLLNPATRDNAAAIDDGVHLLPSSLMLSVKKKGDMAFILDDEHHGTPFLYKLQPEQFTICRSYINISSDDDERKPSPKGGMHKVKER